MAIFHAFEGRKEERKRARASRLMNMGDEVKGKREQKEGARFQERQTAMKIAVVDLIQGEYIKASEEFTPNYILTRAQEKVSRVNVIGVILNVDITNPQQQLFTLDDGTGTITARTFEPVNRINGLHVGDIVQVIGRSRAFQGSVYLIPEIVTHILDTRFVTLRKLELQRLQQERAKKGLTIEPSSPKTVDETLIVEEETIKDDSHEEGKHEEKNSFEILIELIKKNDSGDGADVEAVLSEFKGDGEKLVKVLLEEGEIFEIKPGKIKVLE